MGTDKKEAIKRIIEKLHEGADPESVKAEFAESLGGATATEISQAEEELIREGMPQEKVRKLCDVHLAVFKESLEGQTSLAPEGHPVHILMEEHRILLSSAEELYSLVSSINSDSPEKGRLARIKHLVAHFKDSEKHYLREENVLFPYLEKHGVTQPPAIMWMEHDQIRDVEKALYSLVVESDEKTVRNMAEIKEASLALMELLKSHFYKENNILFPTAMKVITNDEWSAVESDFEEIGYCCFTPGVSAIEEQDKVQLSATVDTGVVSFDSGQIPIRTLEAILNTLPVDITFVGADDRVKYFSQSSERIFVRSKAVIGREVQNCHPKKSMHVVNKILDDFRDGKRDSAEFWIQLNGKTIHIRYFAVRDDETYLGCLEVSQDITEIKKIEGQKRLLD